MLPFSWAPTLKSAFFSARHIKVLCHLVSFKGVHPHQEKAKVVAHYPMLATFKHVRTSLGLSTYYIKCLSNFSHLLHFLNDLIRGDSYFRRGLEQGEHFKTQKSVLTTAPVLCHILERFVRKFRQMLADMVFALFWRELSSIYLLSSHMPVLPSRNAKGNIPPLRRGV